MFRLGRRDAAEKLAFRRAGQRIYPRDTRTSATLCAARRCADSQVAGKGERMSDDATSPLIGHNRPPLTDEERAELLERVAEDLWLSRDDRSWEQAGDQWRHAFRRLVTTTISSYERHLVAIHRT